MVVRRFVEHRFIKSSSTNWRARCSFADELLELLRPDNVGSQSLSQCDSVTQWIVLNEQRIDFKPRRSTPEQHQQHKKKPTALKHKCQVITRMLKTRTQSLSVVHFRFVGIYRIKRTEVAVGEVVDMVENADE